MFAAAAFGLAYALNQSAPVSLFEDGAAHAAVLRAVCPEKTDIPELLVSIHLQYTKADRAEIVQHNILHFDSVQFEASSEARAEQYIKWFDTEFLESASSVDGLLGARQQAELQSWRFNPFTPIKVAAGRVTFKLKPLALTAAVSSESKNEEKSSAPHVAGVYAPSTVVQHGLINIANVKFVLVFLLLGCSVNFHNSTLTIEPRVSFSLCETLWEKGIEVSLIPAPLKVLAKPLTKPLTKAFTYVPFVGKYFSD
eukprot:m.30707 g.30707  ORF g.30707 m.30707 type:complete len:254 (+) comp9526_c0_seq1:369-1130(+)